MAARKPRIEKTGLKEVERVIRARADFSMAFLGLAFMRNGSGRFLNIRGTVPSPRVVERTKALATR